MISILLPCYNSEKLLSKVFMQSSFGLLAEIIAYDNGGNGKEKYEHLNIKWVGDGKNVGLNVALNECVKHAKYDYFYLTHTDMFLMPGWDAPLVNIANKYAPGTFLFCSRSVEKVQGHTPFHIIDDYGQEPDSFIPKNLLSAFQDHRDYRVVTGYRMPFFLDRTLWNKMGGVDPNYFSYGTDNDLFMSAYDIGVRRFWMINQSLVYHMQGKSNSQQTVDKNSNEPYVYFNRKWGSKGYNTHLHIDALEQSLIPWNLKIQ